MGKKIESVSDRFDRRVTLIIVRGLRRDPITPPIAFETNGYAISASRTFVAPRVHRV